jgi:hypothetical protein
MRQISLLFPCSEGKSGIFCAAKGLTRASIPLIRLANPPLATLAAHISEEFLREIRAEC